MTAHEEWAEDFVAAKKKSPTQATEAWARPTEPITRNYCCGGVVVVVLVVPFCICVGAGVVVVVVVSVCFIGSAAGVVVLVVVSVCFTL